MKLIYREPGARTAKTYELFKRITSIGSGEDNDISLRDDQLEETHALIQFDGRAFSLQSIARTNNMFVNGKALKRHTLEHGDEVLIGATSLTFRLYETTDRHTVPETSDLTESYKKILHFSERLLGKHDLKEVLNEAMDAIIELTNANKGFLILAENKKLKIKVARNLEGKTIQDAMGQLSDSIVNEVLRTHKPLIVSDALHDDAFASSLSVISLKLCSVMCVPLISQNEILGLIYVGNDNVVNLFLPSHLNTLVIFAAQISLIIANALLVDELRLDNQELRDQIDNMRFGTIIGTSDIMRSVYRRVDKVARTDVSVLIEGETGTGKELIAKELHSRSGRHKGPFITINSGAIPENLLESELFGHVRGAFTGATSNHTGKFQAANGGTLFLDEIGEMPLKLQVKILRAIQDRTVTRVGASRQEKVDIRIVAATHRNLRKMISEGTFREDLYYRLNVVSLTLPPLRDRKDDVILIAQFFLERYAKEFNVGSKRFNKKGLLALKKYAWPGNIRQLENHIKKAVILAEQSVITDKDLDLHHELPLSIIPLTEAKAAWQREYIQHALDVNNGNRTKTARDLAVDPRTIFRFLEKEAERKRTEKKHH